MKKLILFLIVLPLLGSLAAAWFSIQPAAAQGEVCYTFERGVSPSGSGNIAVYPPPNCSNGVQYRYGTLLQITAIPFAGNSFAYWSGDAYGTANPTTVWMYGHRYVVANFTQACYSLTRTSAPTGSGNIALSPAPNCAGGTQYMPGTIVQMTAYAGPGYTFSNWSGSAFGTVNPFQIIMDGPKSVTANFTQPCFNLNRSVFPAGSGSISVSPAPNCANGTQYLPGTIVQMTANPALSFSFASWGGSAYGTANPQQIIMDGPKSVTANFTYTCYTLARSVSPAGSGNITISPQPNCANGTQYQPGSIVEMTANPGPGYFFTRWSGNAFGTVNPFSIIMDGHKSVTASFAAPNPAISQVSPEMLLAGGAGFTLSVSGSNFLPGSLLRWNSYDLATQWLNHQTLEAFVPANYIAAPGIGWIQVFIPGPGGGVISPAVGIAVGGINPAPLLQRADPPFLPARGQPGTLQLIGRNFTSGAQVYWNGAPLPTTFTKSTNLLAAVPGAFLTEVHTVQVVVVNPAPGGGSSVTLPFSVLRAIYLPVIHKHR